MSTTMGFVFVDSQPYLEDKDGDYKYVQLQYCDRASQNATDVDERLPRKSHGQAPQPRSGSGVDSDSDDFPFTAT